MKYKSKAENISIEDIKQVEKSLKIKLPQDYINHMLEYNGIDPKGNYYFRPNIWNNEIYFSYTLPIKYGTDIFEDANLDDELEDYPEMQITIGVTYTGDLSMSLKKGEYGSIYVYYSDGEMHKLANSFTEFLQGLEEYEDDY